MKEFNLEEAKAGKAVCTRDGRPARIICFDKKSDNYPIIALVNESDGRERGVSYDYKGRYSKDGYCSDYDLMMVGVKTEGWINIYPDHSCSCHIFDTEEEAKKYKYGIGTTIKITWEE